MAQVGGHRGRLARRLGAPGGVLFKGRQFPPTTSYAIVTKQAVTRGLLTKWFIPTFF